MSKYFQNLCKLVGKYTPQRWGCKHAHTVKGGGLGQCGVQISLFFSMLSLDEVENNEVTPIVNTQHSHTFLCMPLYTHGSAKWWDRLSERPMHYWLQSNRNLVFKKLRTWNLFKPRLETLLWLSRSSTYVPKHIPSWMSTVNRKVALSTADHDSPLPCFGFCFHHLQARCCKPEHSGLISLSERKIVSRSTWARPSADHIL